MEKMVIYVVGNKKTGEFSMCANFQSAIKTCTSLEKQGIGYTLEKHEVATENNLPVMDPPPIVTKIQDWDPDTVGSKPDTKDIDYEMLDEIIKKNIIDLRTAASVENSKKENGVFAQAVDSFFSAVYFHDVVLNEAPCHLHAYAQMVLLGLPSKKYLDTVVIFKNDNDLEKLILASMSDPESSEMINNSINDLIIQMLHMACESYKAKNGAYPAGFPNGK